MPPCTIQHRDKFTASSENTNITETAPDFKQMNDFFFHMRRDMNLKSVGG